MVGIHVVHGDMSSHDRKFDLERSSKAVADYYFERAKELLIKEKHLDPVMFLIAEEKVHMLSLDPIFGAEGGMEMANKVVLNLVGQTKGIAVVIAGEFSTTGENHIEKKGFEQQPCVVTWSQFKDDDAAIRFALIEREGRDIKRIIEPVLPVKHAVLSNLSVFNTKRDNSYESDGLYRGNEKVD